MIAEKESNTVVTCDRYTGGGRDLHSRLSIRSSLGQSYHWQLPVNGFLEVLTLAKVHTYSNIQVELFSSHYSPPASLRPALGQCKRS